MHTASRHVSLFFSDPFQCDVAQLCGPDNNDRAFGANTVAQNTLLITVSLKLQRSRDTDGLPLSYFWATHGPGVWPYYTSG